MICKHAQLLPKGCGNGIPSRAVLCAAGMPNPCFINCTPSCLRYEPKNVLTSFGRVAANTPVPAVQAAEKKDTSPQRAPGASRQDIRTAYRMLPPNMRTRNCGGCGGGNHAAMK